VASVSHRWERAICGIEIIEMLWADQIRGWRRDGLSGLLCTALLAIACAQIAHGQASTSTAGTVTSASAPTAKTTAEKPPAKKAKTHTAKHRSTSTRASATKNKSARGKQVGKKRGQQGIDPTRAREIQSALIREHYMQGEPSGLWDSSTQAAMQRYQADHGWQAKQIPDSRALITLGLGPNHDHLLNPESAMTTPPASNPKAGTKQAPAEKNLPQQ
jgi:peptidoglycan hydrolase-like protein with peptidoglycan-binding domain